MSFSKLHFPRVYILLDCRLLPSSYVIRFQTCQLFFGDTRYLSIQNNYADMLLLKYLNSSIDEIVFKNMLMMNVFIKFSSLFEVLNFSENVGYNVLIVYVFIYPKKPC